MNSNPDSHNLTDFSEEAETSETLSIDEFFRQLEAKERDLDISAELVIEVDEDDDNDDNEQPAEESAQIDLFVIKPEFEPPLVETVDNTAFSENPPSRIELFNLKNEVLKLQTQLLQKENERTEMIESARRRHNDFENYKNRTERERTDIFRKQIINLAGQMLPVLDNMNRALDSTKLISKQKTGEFQQFFEGIELVSQQLNEILAEMGVQPIIAVGEDFDPHLHEAVATETSDKLTSNVVLEELLRGYRIGEKIIRPSMVKVSVASPSGIAPESLRLPETTPAENE